MPQGARLEELLILQKNQIGMLQKFVTNFKKLDKIRFTRENLTARLEMLESYRKCSVLTSPYVSLRILMILNIQKRIFSLRLRVNTYLATKIKINELLSKEIVTESAGNKTGYHNEIQDSELSKVMIPEFDGNINKWEDFRDMFVSVIHNDLKIPLIKKMHCLKGCLKGDASAVISRMELSAENYETAWELIVQRYDNQRLESDLRDLFETEPLTETSVEGIGAAMDSVHQLMLSLVLK